MSRTRHLLSVIGSFCIHFVIGTEYITGNTSVYFASYLRTYDPSVTLSHVNTILPIQIAVSTIFIGIGTKLYLHYGARTTVAIGNGLIITAVLGTSCISSLAGYLVVYGGLYGAGVGISVRDIQYTAPVMLSWSYFPQHKACISGVVIAGFGLGPAVFSLVATRLVNPNNESPSIAEADGGVTYHYFDQSISDQVPEMLRWLSLSYLALTVLAVFLLTTQNQYQMIEDSTEISAPSVIAGIKTKQFALLFAAASLSTSKVSSVYGFYVVSNYKSFGGEHIQDDRFLAVIGSISAFCNGSARFVWSYLMQRTSFKLAYLTLLGTQAVLAATIYFVASSPTLYLLWVCASLSCEGGHFCLFPAVTAHLHGKE
jgi:MFS family permease